MLIQLHNVLRLATVGAALADDLAHATANADGHPSPARRAASGKSAGHAVGSSSNSPPRLKAPLQISHLSGDSERPAA